MPQQGKGAKEKKGKKGKKGRRGENTEEPPEQALSPLREYFLTIVVCTVIALFVTTFIVHPMSVPTPSMEPTILVGDRILVDKFTIRNGHVPGLPLVPGYTVQRQDVIVCKAPREPEILLVKRVVGIPGIPWRFATRPFTSMHSRWMSPTSSIRTPTSILQEIQTQFLGT